MADIHIPTPDTKLASALSTLGFPSRLRIVHDDVSGKDDITWQIGTSSLTRPGVKLHELIAFLRNGTLEIKDPGHPLLDGLGALRNRERILSLLKQGRSIALAEDQSGTRTSYIHHPTITPPVSFGRYITRDFRLVCALGRFGFPLVKFQGTSGNYEFTVTMGSVLKLTPLFASVIAEKLKDDTLDAEHGIRYAIKTLENHSRLLKAIAETSPKILLRKPKSSRAAWVDANATASAFDQVRRHFKV